MSGPTPRQRAMFFRCLAALFAAGLPLNRSLLILADQGESRLLSSAARGVATLLTAGSSLSGAMARFGDAFTRLQVALIRIGESTGSLSLILSRLSDYEERQAHLSERVRAALTYPLIVSAASLVMVILLPTFVLDGLFRTLETSGVTLPWLTRGLIAVAGLLRQPWLYAAFLGTVLGARFWLARDGLPEPARIRLEQGLLKVPVLGPSLRLVAVVRFAQATEILSQVGFPLLRGFDLAADASGSRVLRARIRLAADALTDGSSLAGSLQTTDFFPRTFVDTLRVGEEAGKLSQLLGRLAEMYHAQLEYALTAAVAAIEPVMLGLMGVLVGVIVVATVGPLTQLIELL